MGLKPVNFPLIQSIELSKIHHAKKPPRIQVPQQHGHRFALHRDRHGLHRERRAALLPPRVTCAGSQRGWLGIGMADYARRVASLYWLVTIVLTLYKPYIYTQVFIYIYMVKPHSRDLLWFHQLIFNPVPGWTEHRKRDSILGWSSKYPTAGRLAMLIWKMTYWC